jgi:hypothetical protein
VAALNTRTTTERGYGTQWQKLRAWWLGQHPLCGDRESGSSSQHSVCAASGRVVAATVVDHIVPHRGDESLLHDVKNLQSLCKPCHDRKTALEDGGFKARDARRFVVVGPPGSGKTTWVKSRAKQGELVFDLDHLADVVAGMPAYPRPPHVMHALLAMRNGLIEWLSRASPAVSAYVVVMDKAEGQRIADRIKAKMVDLGS